MTNNQSTNNKQRTTNNEQQFYLHESSFVDDGAVVGAGSKIWHFSHVMSGAVIGESCILGQNVNIAGDVAIGNNVKIQNNVSVYAGATIEDDVFLGPSCVLTNVTNPRSQVSRHNLYERTIIRRGATVGANATIVCGITIGRYAFIAAGAVVIHDLPDYSLVMGNPAVQTGWMSRHGHKLKTTNEPRQTTNEQQPTIMICPESGLRYQMTSNEPSPTILDQQPTTNNQQLSLKCLDLDEEAPLPTDLTQGTKSYDEFKLNR